MHAVTIEEAQAHLPELIAEAQRGGEVVIQQGGSGIVQLTPLKPDRAQPVAQPLSQVDFRAIRRRIWGEPARFFTDEEIQRMKNAEDGLVP